MRQAELLFARFRAWGFDSRGWAQKTRRNYEYRARAADSWMRTHKNKSIFIAKPKDFEDYLFSTKPHARNRNNIRQALVGFGDFLVYVGYATQNPAIGLPKLKQTKVLPGYLDEKQAQTLIETARVFGPMVEALFGVLLYAGLRRDECRLLEWANVYDDRIRFEATKSRRVRQIPLHEDASLALHKWRVNCFEAKWVFPSPRRAGYPISESHMATIVRDVGSMAGIHLHPHLLRHTAATALYQATGGDLRTVQEFLGHANPQTTAVYTHVSQSRLSEAVKRLNYGGGEAEKRRGIVSTDPPPPT